MRQQCGCDALNVWRRAVPPVRSRRADKPHYSANVTQDTAAQGPLDAVRAGYAFEGPALELGAAVWDGAADPSAPVRGRGFGWRGPLPPGWPG